ncbi:hypothetical protein Tco_0768589 [Tanacetum coccineum]
MSIDNNKPPDPIVEEFRILTKMTSSDDVHLVSSNVFRAKAVKGKLHKPRRGSTIKVSTPGSNSAGAGSLLKRLRSAKVSGKARDRAESSPFDDRGGKRVVSNPENDVIKKVLSDVKSGSIDCLKFDIGSSDDNVVNCPLNKDSDAIGLSPHIDGSFIKEPLCPFNDSGMNLDSGCPVASCSDLKDKVEPASTGGVGNASHVHPIPVVSTTSAMTGMEFEFGKVDSSKGILKKPLSPLLNVQFGSNIPVNPFVKSLGGNKGKDNWISGEATAFGARIMANQYSAVADSFAEKLKQGAEELALKMEYMPNSVSKLDNGGRRISFTAEEVIKGGAECSLQLYGYFVGTSMDYRVVRANLMKMWRSYGIVDITKTNSGIFYFKFKSEEGMKNVLESGPWMVQNIPLVLNLWEPGIWLEKVEPSTIPIWVCVYNIPMELCNGGSIGKIMSGIGKPLLMDNMTKERCLKKAGKLDFARVLVEVSADDELPNVLEIAYPPIGNSPAKIGKLDVKYQWKPDRFVALTAKTLFWNNKSSDKKQFSNSNYAPVNDENKGKSGKREVFKKQVWVVNNNETHVKKKKLASICSRVLGRWEWVSNNSAGSGGTRIIVGWDPNCVNVMVVEQSAQVIHCFIEPLNGDSSFYCSFVYAHVHTVDRRSLWKSLQKFKCSIRDSPWVVLGDFNATLDPSEKSQLGVQKSTHMSELS